MALGTIGEEQRGFKEGGGTNNVIYTFPTLIGGQIATKINLYVYLTDWPKVLNKINNEKSGQNLGPH